MRKVIRENLGSRRLIRGVSSYFRVKIKGEDALEVDSQSNVSHGHVGGDEGCLEHTLSWQWRAVTIFPCLVLLDVAWCC